MKSRNTLPKSCRLFRQRDFQRVLSTRCRAGDRRLVVYVAPNDLPFSRLGVRAGRDVGGAVVRNRLKRLVREAFRLARDRLPVGLDIVCILRRAESGGLEHYIDRLPRLVGTAARRLSA